MLPNSTVRDETTLSLAMKPEIKAVTIRQSPKPTGRNTGASTPRQKSQDAVLGVRHHVKARVKVLKEPDGNGSQEDHRKGTLEKILRLVPQKMAHIGCSRHPW